MGRDSAITPGRAPPTNSGVRVTTTGEQDGCQACPRGRNQTVGGSEVRRSGGGEGENECGGRGEGRGEEDEGEVEMECREEVRQDDCEDGESYLEFGGGQGRQESGEQLINDGDEEVQENLKN